MVPALFAAITILPLSELKVNVSVLSDGTSLKTIFSAWAGMSRLARALAATTLSGSVSLVHEASKIAVANRPPNTFMKFII